MLLSKSNTYKFNAKVQKSSILKKTLLVKTIVMKTETKVVPNLDQTMTKPSLKQDQSWTEVGLKYC